MIADYFESLVRDLISSPAISSFKVLRKNIGDEDGFIRVKCTLSDTGIFEFAEYALLKLGKIHLEYYSYHWQGHNWGRPMLLIIIFKEERKL